MQAISVSKRLYLEIDFLNVYLLSKSIYPQHSLKYQVLLLQTLGASSEKLVLEASCCFSLEEQQSQLAVI